MAHRRTARRPLQVDVLDDRTVKVSNPNDRDQPALVVCESASGALRTYFRHERPPRSVPVRAERPIDAVPPG